jgi:hypothetical protein
MLGSPVKALVEAEGRVDRDGPPYLPGHVEEDFL